MKIKSEYLIHWTGKDICFDITKLNDEHRNAYAQRLNGTCKNGLWMMPNVEQIIGFDNFGFRSFSYITCFTDNRSSYYKIHAGKYGMMGLGFSRKWVIDRDGMPAIYLKNSTDDILTTNITQLAIELERKRTNSSEDHMFYMNFSLLFDYVKPMSDLNANDFCHLEDAEWRIVWNSRQDGINIIENRNSDKPKFYIPITPADLKLLILPDNETRKIVMDKSFFKVFLQEGNYETLIVSLEELDKI